ncbi:hypothetical protein [Nocardioides sp.]|uniref:hypothetical protein n=1 Tax=Nocardioides sp. TaxID=35761 RepID=UPI00286CD850|nr:hypothetical protein [Nocardioides sp.]
MGDEEFLDEVRRLLPDLVADQGLEVLDVRVVDGRPWPRVEVGFRLSGTPPRWWHAPTAGVARAPFGADWRDLSAHDVPEDYAWLLEREVSRAARRLNDEPQAPPTVEEVAERWPWLLERLALLGPVVDLGDGRVRVTDEDGEITVVVTPEEWARIAEPLDHHADDPQDFNPTSDDEVFLVFYEDELCWSVREELPPVPAGADFRRRAREARTRGDESTGWFAYAPLEPLPRVEEPEDDAVRSHAEAYDELWASARGRSVAEVQEMLRDFSGTFAPYLRETDVAFSARVMSDPRWGRKHPVAALRLAWAHRGERSPYRSLRWLWRPGLAG